MKKTLILLAVAVAALAFLLFKRGSDRKAMQVDTPALDSTTRAEAVTFKIAKKPDTTVLALKNGAWVVQRDSFPVDTGKVARALGHIFGLKAKEKVSENAARLAEYGLDSAEAKHIAILDKDGKPLAEVVVGKTSGADYSSTYWKWEGKPQVYRTPGNFAYELGAKDEEWKERKLFRFAAKDIKFLEVSWKDTTGAAYSYKLEALTDSTWKMLQPTDSNRVVAALANDAASRFTDMGIDEFVAAGDTNVAKAALDSATTWAKVTLEDGRTFEVKAGKPYANFYYVKNPTRPETVKLSGWRFDSFKKKPFELLEAPPAPKDTSAAGKAAEAAAAAQGGHGAHDGHGH
jgi:hypothetical protein